MAVTDPVDTRLLAALADLGKAAVHELAAKVGMDPREVAYRLVALSGSGLPLLVGVESDPNGLRAAIAGAPPSWANRPPQFPPPSQPVPSQPPAPPMPPPVQGTPSGPYTVQGAPSGPYNVQGAPSGPYTVQGAPSGPYNVQGAPSGPYNVQGTPSGRYPGPPPQQQPPRPPRPFTPPPVPLDPAVSTWGVPQTASWARGDEPARPSGPAAGKRGRLGEVMETQGLEGEQLSVQLLEVQDPADYLFSAAGYRLEDGERAVVVHTEITNRGSIPFASLPDNYLELLAADGQAIGKAPVSLTSRPPHKIGVKPGETLGGHTVYVLPDATRVVSVRWSPRPEPDERTLTWSIEDQ
ncbi:MULTISPECIES: AsnC family protein [unclassified Amycolatopsis]|uniref:AsnC family protein n=1 Tax=unclassified Amycolatopsis TaxID=2618356 RepID=UPI002874C08B|nr:MULTISPECIES: AsnC family protein [unclassified Amycolatopsis]MDS0140502.1 AsnC family protein [Amycolatopsis sp. 505]MDS0148602.1 AsnC family protein [Amycolatopsis sp. CM201R]